MNANPPSGSPSHDLDKVSTAVKAIVAEQMGIEVTKIRDNDALEEDLGCDSLDIVEISMELEEHFGVSIPDEFGDGVQTIADVADGIRQLLAECDLP